MTEKNYAPSKNASRIDSKRNDSAKSEDKMKATKTAPAAAAPVKAEEKAETKAETKIEDKKEESSSKNSQARSTSEKKETKKQEIKPKEFAVARGVSVQISPKHSYAICDMIKGKTPDRAIEMLQEVLLFKRAVPMNNREIPHRHGMMAGRYPINASKEFIELIKQLRANASTNGIDNPIIFIAKADRASRPHRRGGVRSKRAHVYLEARDKAKIISNKLAKKKK